MSGFFRTLSQFFPPRPHFTEKDLPDLKGKVYIITGSNTGIGKALAQLLYSRNAKVYVAARSEEKSKQAIKEIEEAEPRSEGRLVFLSLDLADLAKVKASAQNFLSQESRLHVLFNNAGLQAPPPGSESAQGYELQLGVHCVGHFLFAKLLTPTLAATAKLEPAGSVRVVWVASAGAALGSAKPHGIDLDNLDFHNDVPQMTKYAYSKAGNYYQGTEYAKRHRADGIVSIPLNPGHLASELYREHGGFFNFVLGMILLYPSIYGAYTELYAGFSPDITLENSGQWVVPWGRFMGVREDLVAGSKAESEGGTGIARKFWEWNEEQVKPFL